MRSILAFGALAAAVSAALGYLWRDVGRSSFVEQRPASSQPRSESIGSGGAEVDVRSHVAAIAREQLGRAELDRYFADAAPAFVGSHAEWCGIFALWVLHQAGLGVGIQWRIGLGFLYRLPVTTDPKVGDIAYFTANQHHAIVVGVHADTVDVINGNGQGGVVSASSPLKSKAAAYYSIQPWIDVRNA